MRIVGRFSTVVGVVGLVACGEVAPSSPPDAAAPIAADAGDGAADRLIGPIDVGFEGADAGLDVADAGLDADARAPNACDGNAFTDATCALATGGAATRSALGACDDAGASCELVTDDAGANPPVWCCF